MAVAYTLKSKVSLGKGLVKTITKCVLDNAYPVAGYDVSNPANFGLSSFQVNQTGDAFVDPVVVDDAGTMKFNIRSLKLLGFYPTGGSVASPTVLAAPSTASVVVTTTPDAGATGLTGSAAKPALVGVNTGGLTPGLAKALANNTDLSTITVYIEAVGFPA
jgi:hypothetical protein